jgi:transcriptional regulator with XRE-family HTH domain
MISLMTKEKSMRALLAERTRVWMARVPEAGTQAKLSARAGMSQSSIHRVLFQTTEPELDTAFKLASAFGITVSELLSEEDMPAGVALPFDIDRYRALPESEKEKIKAFAEFVMATHEVGDRPPSIVAETIHATPEEKALTRRVAQRNLTTDTLSTHENQQKTHSQTAKRNKSAGT